MATIGSRLKHAWNAFVDQDEKRITKSFDYGPAYSNRPDRSRRYFHNERTIIASINTRMSMDAASTEIRHVRVDDNGRFLEEIKSGLNECLTVEANIDQAARHFRQDIFMSMVEKGVVAIVPVDTTLNPNVTGGYDILSMRIGEIMDWYPQHVRVRVYNEAKAIKEDVILPKKAVAIVENPLYSVMNEPNSTLQRLIRKLSMLDSVDEAASSGKLDLIIQLPYVIKSEARRTQAEQRRKDIEFQLSGSRYGIAYTDGTERITQLNRPTENNLWKQILDLTALLYEQLGLTPEIMNGTASEQAMLNYQTRTIEPLLDAVVEAMKRSFLTKTARSQMQSIEYFRDPFKLVPLNNIAEIADKMTRNEILSANEIRSFIGVKPADDPKADELRNSNMPQVDETPTTETTKKEGVRQNES